MPIMSKSCLVLAALTSLSVRKSKNAFDLLVLLIASLRKGP